MLIEFLICFSDKNIMGCIFASIFMALEDNTVLHNVRLT